MKIQQLNYQKLRQMDRRISFVIWIISWIFIVIKESSTCFACSMYQISPYYGIYLLSLIVIRIPPYVGLHFAVGLFCVATAMSGGSCIWCICAHILHIIGWLIQIPTKKIIFLVAGVCATLLLTQLTIIKKLPGDFTKYPIHIVQFTAPNCPICHHQQQLFNAITPALITHNIGIIYKDTKDYPYAIEKIPLVCIVDRDGVIIEEIEGMGDEFIPTLDTILQSLTITVW